jgi:calcium binding protein
VPTDTDGQRPTCSSQERKRRKGREKARAKAEVELGGWAGSTNLFLRQLGIWYTTGDTSTAPRTVDRDEVFRYQRRQMARQDNDDKREERIRREILVDVWSRRASVRMIYLPRDTLHFPFTASCIARRVISPLEPGAELEIVGITPEEECRHEMFVLTRWRPHELAIPLIQVEGIHADEKTQQAIEDWRYWVNQGHELSA